MSATRKEGRWLNGGAETSCIVDWVRQKSAEAYSGFERGCIDASGEVEETDVWLGRKKISYEMCIGG